eukprot:1150685-Pelagomonas_calceolata.AAC.1
MECIDKSSQATSWTRGYKGLQGEKRPQSRLLTSSLFMNAHEVMKEKRMFVVILEREVVLKKRGILLTERVDLGIGTSEQHMRFILYCIGITDITDRKSIIGPIGLFNP